MGGGNTTLKDAATLLNSVVNKNKSSSTSNTFSSSVVKITNVQKMDLTISGSLVSCFNLELKQSMVGQQVLKYGIKGTSTTSAQVQIVNDLTNALTQAASTNTALGNEIVKSFSAGDNVKETLKTKIRNAISNNNKSLAETYVKASNVMSDKSSQEYKLTILNSAVTGGTCKIGQTEVTKLQEQLQVAALAKACLNANIATKVMNKVSQQASATSTLYGTGGGTGEIIGGMVGLLVVVAIVGIGGVFVFKLADKSDKKAGGGGMGGMFNMGDIGGMGKMKGMSGIEDLAESGMIPPV